MGQIGAEHEELRGAEEQGKDAEEHQVQAGGGRDRQAQQSHNAPPPQETGHLLPAQVAG